MIKLVRQKLAWPSASEIFEPTGNGARIVTSAADQKIGGSLRRLDGAPPLRVGALVSDPGAETTEQPFALVCEFSGIPNDDLLRETHRLAWNFSRAPLLITLDPSSLRVWSCLEAPLDPAKKQSTLTGEISELHTKFGVTPVLRQSVIRALHWFGIVEGQVFRLYADRFPEESRADRALLENLRGIRQALIDEALPMDITHDLLARLIFVQFLFDRKDAQGRSALDAEFLQRLTTDGVLLDSYADLGGILESHEDTYRLFRWLNGRFNGDLFPGNTAQVEEDAWRQEMEEVTPNHLSLLKDFVTGQLRFSKSQYSLWRLYSFDTIPLDFISSIYEEFVHKEKRASGAHYTPGHVVDFLLDAVLPWKGTEWDLKILDPSCGCGIFLVKAFQRLIYRWRLANDGIDPPPKVLIDLLSENIWGVDLDRHAVRVASFSLYLALCDAVDPRRYWRDLRFPQMRDRRLHHADFFVDGIDGIDTEADEGRFDLVVGNAPWGQGTATEPAQDWSSRHDWPLPNRDVGTLFLPKAAHLTCAGGRVAMLQSTAGLLGNQQKKAKEFRERLFREFTVEEVTNFSAFRFEKWFAKSVAPVSAIVLSPQKVERPVTYRCPKANPAAGVAMRFEVGQSDVHSVSVEEAGSDPVVWSVLMWGGRRDLEFIRRLSRHETLGSLKESGRAAIRKGITWGKRTRLETFEQPMRLLEGTDLPKSSDDLRDLELVRSVRVYSKDTKDMEAFLAPQLLIKKSWSTADRRFTTRWLDARPDAGGVLCDQGIISVHFKGAEPGDWAKIAEAVFNSSLAVYYLMLASGRMAFGRPEPLQGVFEAMPIPRTSALSGRINSDDLDVAVGRLFGLSEVDQILVDDIVEYHLPGLHATDRREEQSESPYRGRVGAGEPVVNRFAISFMRVLGAGFGSEKPIGARIISPQEQWGLKVVTFQIGECSPQELTTEQSLSEEVLGELTDAFHSSGRLSRSIRIYDVAGGVPMIHVVKPNRAEEWLPSAGLHEADQVAADLVAWSAGMDRTA